MQPVQRTQFFVQPNTAATLRFSVSGEAGAYHAELRDFQGKIVSSVPCTVRNGELTAEVKLPAGFYELNMQPGGQKFGLVSLPAYAGETDEFFGMDAALSWLETRAEVRNDLAAILKRSGIGVVRERLSWGAMNPQPGTWDWETPRQFKTLRSEYAKHGLKVLDMFHSTPAWAKPLPGNPFPQDLAKTKTSWQTVAERWRNVWSGFEVWNEPDIESGGEVPADQYLPSVKTFNYAFRENGTATPIGGGVFGYFNPGYIQTSVRNGLLDNVDFVSFHTYAKAPAMEQIITDYRKSLAVEGKPPVPLWLTESGQPWKTGPARPLFPEDSTTALDIAMKAVESKACGLAVYFAFVYPYYVEGARNFGMMGQEASPLRSMAAYTQSVRALSNREYVGDLVLSGSPTDRARVFASGNDALVVLYKENADAETKVAWNSPVERVEGIDGRVLERGADGSIPLSDGLAYVYAPTSSLRNKMRTDGAAFKLYQQGKTARSSRKVPSALVLQPLPPQSVPITKRGYNLTSAITDTLPIQVRVTNLASTPTMGTIHCLANGASIGAEKTVNLGPLEAAELTWDVPVEFLKGGGADSVVVSFGGKENNGTATSPAAMELFYQHDLPTYLKNYPASARLEIEDTSRWQAKVSGTGRMKLNADTNRVWKLEATFTGGDRWVYPELRITDTALFSNSQGILLRGRATAPGTVRLMIKERSGATYFTPFSVLPADGKWHDVLLRWQDLAALPSAPPDPNGKLDFDHITAIAAGMNSKADTNTLELSDLYIARRAG